jgi:hypothetical protein
MVRGVLRLTDDCTIPDDQRSWAYQVVVDESLVISGDSITVDGKVVAYRLEPVGFGDVHWQLADHGAEARYTHIEVRA